MSTLQRPRAQYADAHWLKVSNVPCHNGQAVNQRLRRDERGTLQPRIGNFQSSAVARDLDVHARNSAAQSHAHPTLQPLPKQSALDGIATFDTQDANLQLAHCDGGKPKRVRRYALRPSAYCGVDASRLAEFRHYIRIQKIHPSKSADRVTRSIFGGSNSKSSLHGIASASKRPGPAPSNF